MQSVKTIVVGDSGVGKTCILLRYVYDQFQQFSTPTVGASFISKIHSFNPNESIRFQIWDTAGQQRYKSIAPIYYKDSRVAICVYDITNRATFQIMKNWVQTMKVDGPQDMIYAIVGNKLDLIEKQQVSIAQGQQFSKQIGGIFKLTSAKDRSGINQLFSEIALKVKDIKMTTREKGVIIQQIKEPKKWKHCCYGN